MLATRPPLAPLCLALLLAAPATARATAPAEAPAEPAPPPGKGRVKVEFYLMSQCPFAADVVGKIKGVVDQLGDDRGEGALAHQVELHLDPALTRSRATSSSCAP